MEKKTGYHIQLVLVCLKCLTVRQIAEQPIGLVLERFRSITLKRFQIFLENIIRAYSAIFGKVRKLMGNNRKAFGYSVIMVKI